VKPREGQTLAVLSTGYAQEYDGTPGRAFGGEDIGTGQGEVFGKDWGTTGQVPAGFPKAAAGCDQAPDVHDVVQMKLALVAPPNAAGFKFDFDFYSGEWPAYVCSKFNDGFIAYLEHDGGSGGDNVSFDKNKNPVSVNNGFFDRCTPNVPIGCAKNILDGTALATPGTSQCPSGTAELGGTGFGIVNNWCAIYTADPSTGQIADQGQKSVNGGATGWLTSQAPVKPGEHFTLTFYIWDTGDGLLDSSVLLDHFTWVGGDVSTTTDRPR
jgi:hypothetical protein